MEYSRILLVALAFAASRSDAVAQPSEPRPLSVVLHDQVGISPAFLAAAREAVDGLFRDAGVPIQWAEREPTGDTRAFLIRVLLRPRDPAWTPKRSPIMGVALASDADKGVAMVYYESITGAARRYGQPVPDLLAIAIAHEIGHLLLPAPAHSDTGIMRADWQGDEIRHALSEPLRFAAAQAGAIRTRLAGLGTKLLQ